MRKPVNLISKLLLLILLILVGLHVFLGWFQYQTFILFNQVGHEHGHEVSRYVTEQMIRTAVAVIWDVAFFAGLAALIEIGDQIRTRLGNMDKSGA